ncbi:MAG: ABC transporter ATP-binding protein, partial [Planctomycetota bacterium]
MNTGDPASSPEPVVRARGLSMTYGRGHRAVPALRGVDFDVLPGATLGLLGANGSGKSTTIGLVLGLLAPVAGSLSVFGGPAGRRAARARTGYVPEETRRFGTLTGREAVAFFAALQGVGPRAERRRRVEEALTLVGLASRAWPKRVSTYSRGMARRLALATAWVHRPDLLVLDEPTSGLDPLGKEEILALLEPHRRAGGATLLSTHDRVVAETACDHALVLAEGRLAAEGAPRDLLAGDAVGAVAVVVAAVWIDRIGSVRIACGVGAGPAVAAAAVH